MKKILTIACAAMAFAVSPVMAQSNALGGSGMTDARKIINDFDVETLMPILGEMGISYEGRTSPNGEKLLLATAPNGLKFILSPTACQAGANDGCVGLSMAALFGEADQRTVNAFNYRYVFSSAGVDPSGKAYLSRYEICDYGTAKGTLIVSMNVFLSQAKYFYDTLRTSTNTVSLEASPQDFAANALNGAAIGQTHEASLERNADLIRVLVAAEEKNPGKIANFAK